MPRRTTGFRSSTHVTETSFQPSVRLEDLTPTQAARSLGINPTAFRVRLLRARRRLRAKLAGAANDDRFDPNAHFEMEAS